jgi:putative restriction endonuclease
VRGLGRPHNGPDTPDNVLCLCPNHHVLFDAYSIFIDDDFIVRRTVDREALGELHGVA